MRNMNINSAIFLAIVVLGFTAGCTNGDAQESYDLVILNGRVMDPETSFDAVRNVGVKDAEALSISPRAVSDATIPRK